MSESNAKVEWLLAILIDGYYYSLMEPSYEAAMRRRDELVQAFQQSLVEGDPARVITLGDLSFVASSFSGAFVAQAAPNKHLKLMEKTVSILEKQAEDGEGWKG